MALDPLDADAVIGDGWFAAGKTSRQHLQQLTLVDGTAAQFERYLTTMSVRTRTG